VILLFGTAIFLLFLMTWRCLLTSAAPDFATGRSGDRFNRCKLMPDA